MILFGSQAAKNYFPDFRETHDLDWLVKEDNKQAELIDEIRNEYYHIPPFDYLLDQPKGILSPEQLYTLKVSHSFWDIKWEKTMFDINFFQEKNLKLDENLFNELYSFWEIKHKEKRVNLNQSNEKFFNSYVKRKYIHDDIHKEMSYYDEPMFNKLKKDKSKAWINKEMFFNLSKEDQIKTCREEIYVTALERCLIPSDFKIHTLSGYSKACKLLITSMTKGWFPKFIVENWKELRKPDIDYKQKFLNSKLYLDGKE